MGFVFQEPLLLLCHRLFRDDLPAAQLKETLGGGVRVYRLDDPFTREFLLVYDDEGEGIPATFAEIEMHNATQRNAEYTCSCDEFVS